MKWTNQIVYITNKLRKMIYIMKLPRAILDYKYIEIMCLTLFASLITYYVIIGWRGANTIMFYYDFKNAKIQF